MGWGGKMEGTEGGEGVGIGMGMSNEKRCFFLKINKLIN